MELMLPMASSAFSEDITLILQELGCDVNSVKRMATKHNDLMTQQTASPCHGS
jgi:hypothetical protein